MTSVCKDKKLAKHDAAKAEERQAAGQATFTCKKCGRVSHKEAHLCKPAPA